MFFSDNILTRKGPLANIWMAAHWERRLSKAQIVSTDIAASVRDIVSGALPAMALRLSGQLLLGVAKIYSRKARYLLEDCAEALERLRAAFVAAVDEHGAGAGSTAAEGATRAATAAITLPQSSVADDPEPELDLDALLRQRPATSPASSAIAAVPLGLARSAAPFSLDTVRDSDIPSELHPGAFLEDAELGRLSLAPVAPTSPASIEVGRRATLSSLASPGLGHDGMLPFSPLRASSAAGGSVFDAPAMDDAPDFGDDGAVFDAPARVSDEPLAPMDDEPLASEAEVLAAAPVKGAPRRKPAAAPRKRAAPRRRRPVQLDAVTELDAATVQRHVAETAPIVASEADLADGDAIAAPVDTQDLLGVAHSMHHLTLAADAFGDADGLGDDVPSVPGTPARPSAHTPKSPRIMAPGEDDDVPMDFGAPLDDAPVPDVFADGPSSPRSRQSVPLDAAPAAGHAFADAEAALGAWAPLFARARSGTLALGALVAKPARRRQAAEAFLHVLALHTRGLVVASQAAAYGPISVLRV